MRDPSHPGWPEQGERTEHEDIAREWAWAYLRHFQRREHDRQRGIPEPLPTLADALDEWLLHRERTSEPSTVRQSKTVAKHLRRLFGGSASLGAVTEKKLQEWFNERVEDGYRTNTLKSYQNMMRSFLGHFGRSEIAASVDLPNVGSFDPKAWSDEELLRLRRGAEGVAGEAGRRMVDAGIHTGARRNELAALRWNDFDPGRHTVRIERQVRRGSRGLKPLKGKTARTTMVLPGWWGHHNPEGEYVIGVDQPLSEHQMNEMMTEILKAAELNEKGVGLHSLRHTYSRLFLEGGGSLEQLQRFLGHESITTTQRTYGHFGDEAAVRLARQQFYS